MLRPILFAALLGSAVACGEPSHEASSAGTSTSGSGGATSTSATGGTTAGSGGTGGGTASVAWCNRGPSIQMCDPFGVRLEGPDPSTDAYWSLITDGLKLHFYRPAPLFLDQVTKGPAPCAECSGGASHGLYLVLVVRNDGSPLTPTSPPADLGVYKATLGIAIDDYKDALAAVVIEDEVTSPSAYGGDVASYLAQLTAACEVAHGRHVKCADSGLGSTSLLYLLADYYRGAGSTQEAIRILQTATDNPDVPQIFKDGHATDADVAALLLDNQATIAEAKALIAGLRDAGVDYVNFHWYERDEDTLWEAISFLRAATGCNAVITDELGQRTQDGSVAAHQLSDAKELGLPFVIWSAGAGSAPLVDDQGDLLPSGTALETLSTTATCGDG